MNELKQKIQLRELIEGREINIGVMAANISDGDVDKSKEILTICIDFLKLLKEKKQMNEFRSELDAIQGLIK